MLNPKKLILSNISEQFEQNNIKGISEMYILLKANSDKAEIRLKNICDKFEKIDYDIDRKNVLIKIFLNKFKKYAVKNNIDVESYTIRIVFKTETIDIFLKDTKGQIHTIDL